jgi:serine phosphatase RsbU (regulator of sigma subunit)
VLAVLQQLTNGGPVDLLKACTASQAAFLSGQPRFDDLTLLVLQRTDG